MIHSDVKIPGSNSGICNILMAIPIFLIFLFAPLAYTVVNKEVLESFTVAENIDKDSGGVYLFLISLMVVTILVLGILKLTLRKVFQHFVVSVVDFYYSLSLCIGFILMSIALSSQITETFHRGYEIKQMMGAGPILLILCSFIYFITTLGHLCSFYKWYPLQTLFWGLHPVLNILATSFLSLVAIKLLPDSVDDMVLKTVGVIISWGVLFVEIGLLVTYRKEWNRRLRARMKPNSENVKTNLSASLVSMEKQQCSPQEQAAIDKAVERMENKSDEELKDILANPKDYSKSFWTAADIAFKKRKGELPQDAEPEVSATSAPNASNDKPQAVAPSVKKAAEVPDSPASRKKYYTLGGASVLVALSVLFFCLKDRDREKVEAVNVPAIKETFYEGRIGKVEVEMRLKQENDSLYGTYFYKRNKQDLQLSGKIEDGRHVINEFVEGKNTGTFQMDLWEYDGQLSLTGKWSNGKKTFDVYLEDKMHRIIPSTDPEHPFVGEWNSKDGVKFANAELGLYNKDIKGYGYGFFMMEIEEDFRQYRVDSILQLNGNTAVLAMGKEKFTLTYNPSDRSLQLETEKSGSFHLFLDQRDLAQRLADWEALTAAIPPPPEAPSVTETLITVEDDAEIVFEQQNDTPYVSEESDAAAEKARLQAELEAELQKEAEAEDPNKIYDKVEVMPEYPGGYVAMMRYIAQNVEYPTVAQENGTQGKVVVQFVVDTDGSIIHAHVLTSVDPYLDNEALRVIKSMPRWTPGKLNGKPVRVKYTVPVKFRLS